MIELYEGVPGSGKSYHAICEKFLPWVKQGRRLYIAVDGIYLDRLSLFTGIELETVSNNRSRSGRTPSKSSRPFPMSNLAQPSSSTKRRPSFGPCRKVEPGLLRWLETHRHYGVDILLMSQDFRQMSQGVTRLIEATVKFRKLALWALEKVSGQGARESGRQRSHPGLRRHLLAGDLRLLFELCLGGHSRREAQSYRLQVGAGGDWHCGRPVCHRSHGLAALVLTEFDQADPCRINVCPNHNHRATSSRFGQSAEPIGHVSVSTNDSACTEATRANPRRRGMSKDRQGWRYLLDSGEILTAAQITGRYGLSVSEVYEEGSMRLIGEGVFYGPAGD
jgi:zona occludens toxin